MGIALKIISVLLGLIGITHSACNQPFEKSLIFIGVLLIVSLIVYNYASGEKQRKYKQYK